MNNSDSTKGAPVSTSPKDKGFSPWERLKSKRISYLTLPLLIMATVTEFVILATGWKYQKVVCLPQGMGVTFFGIGPIGATILAVELLKLPLAIWTASRRGWQKGIMLAFGLPLICLLTFQLVKDMAVYEMGVALTPAGQYLEKATDEEVKISQLNGQLAAIDQKKADRDVKLATLAAKQAKAKAEIDDSLKRNDTVRDDAISLTDYQRKELSGVEEREATIIKQFDADTAQLTKEIADLRARREPALTAASKWNAEDARIDNAFKAKTTDYQNKKAAFLKDKAEYDSANFLKRQVMSEPVDPGVPPVREVNTILKPVELSDIDDQLKAKEAELLAVNNKRRDRVAQVEAEAHQMRQEYDQRSTTKREESDRKRTELLAAETTLTTAGMAEAKQIDQDYEAAAQNVDGIRTALDASRKEAESNYEAREASIRKTQVHRIATTVEIVRGLLMGQRPMSIQMTAKERGDILTDQISMVRIWVYPVLAFIVAFLPTLMVEIGFSTVFESEQERRPYRLGFLGQNLHWLYIRAGRQKILRAERLAKDATAQISARNKAAADAKTAAEKAFAEKEVELQAAQDALTAAKAEQEAELNQKEEEFAAQSKTKEEEWVSKLAGMADSLNRVVVEKDALRDLQKSEIERQIQMRQNAWSDRITQLRQELDSQRTAAETERSTLMQEHHQKLLEISEDCKTQVVQARRQVADAELAAMEATAKLTHDFKETVDARDAAESQLQQQAETFAIKLSQAKEESAREVEKTTRQEKHRFERQQLEFGKTLRQREEDFERQLKQREQELTLSFETRLTEEQTRAEQDSRRRQAELERQIDARVIEVDARWKKEIQQREEGAQVRLKQREQQLQAQTEVRLTEAQTQAEQELRRVDGELQRQIEAQAREAGTRLKQELQQKELAFQAALKQREQEFAISTGARETELQKQWATDLRVREEEWERQAEARVRTAEARLTQEAQQKEEMYQSKLRQRDQQWQVKLDTTKAEVQAQAEEARRRREAEADARLREVEAQLRREIKEKEEAAQARAKEREQELETQILTRAEARHFAIQAEWETEAQRKIRDTVEPLKALLSRTEKERDEAMQTSTEGARQVQHLEKKLTEASQFFTAWRNGNGKHVVPTS